jgi:hypothetical protein
MCDVTVKGITENTMRFVYWYLIGYFILLIGAVLALWRTGVLERIDTVWLAVVLVITVGLGIVLAVTSVRSTTITK